MWVTTLTAASCESNSYLYGGERRAPEAVTRPLVLLMNESSMAGSSSERGKPAEWRWSEVTVRVHARRGSVRRAGSASVWACERERCAGAQECGPTHPLPMTACKGRFFNAGLVSSHPGRTFNEPSRAIRTKGRL